MKSLRAVLALAIALLPAVAEDRTSFQTAGPWDPAVDIGADQVMIYGVNESFSARLQRWREQGYQVGFMTGISWGGYEAYYGADERRITEEIQTDASGRRFMHGDSTTVGYNVPTRAYLEFLKEYINPAIDAGIDAFYLEEPEYWARTGWSEGFKRAWQDYYGTPWEAPDGSVDAQYKASRLKYELYFNALREIFTHIKNRAAAQGRSARCYVPTHSLVNYAHWRIVSPESRLMDLAIADGYIAQVWTGTARTPNVYRGVRKERTFETAFLEYGQMLSMVRPTGRTVWFLADPVEDDPRHTWADYEYNYKLTLVASLMWPEVSKYEVMPWPDRIFRGNYPLEEGGGATGPMPRDYAVQLLAAINALNDMDQPDHQFEGGSRGIGILISDSLMFQRAEPHPSDPDLASVHALALPLLKQGVPIEPVQLETVLVPAALKPYQVLLLTYEGQKPLRSDYHEALAAWVREGGALLVVGDGADPYHQVKEWWNDGGTTARTAYGPLLADLGLPEALQTGAWSVGKGRLHVLAESPAALQVDPEGGARIQSLVQAALAEAGSQLHTQNYLQLRRGPYVVAMGLDESTAEPPKTLEGPFINVFDPLLAVTPRLILEPGTPSLLYQLDWAARHRPAVEVAVASARITGQKVVESTFEFTARGPDKTPGIAVIRAPAAPVGVTLDPPNSVESTWDEAHKLFRVQFQNTGRAVRVAVSFRDRLGSPVPSPDVGS